MSAGRLAPTLALAAALACVPSLRAREERSAGAAEPGARHSAESRRLRALMGELDRLQRSLLPQEMDLGPERRARREEIAEAARALAGAAGQIPQALDEEAGRTPDERARMRERARVLEDRARVLAEEAPDLPRARLRERVDAVEASCQGCHTRFRQGWEAPDASR